MNIDKFYINGKFITPHGEEKIDIVNPATEEIIGFVISGSEDDVNNAVDSANAAFTLASNLTIQQRKKILEEIIEGMQERRSDFGQDISD